MKNAWARKTIVSAMLAVVLISIVGCAPATYDGVLWRQVAAFKDPLGNALNSATGTERSSFVEGLRSDGAALPGHYWDGISDPANLGLDSGGLVFSNIREGASDVKFNALISSGLRNSAADPFADSKPYTGPSAIYTCFTVAVESTPRAVTSWTYVNGDCESKLVATLSDEARFYPVTEFNG